MTALNAQRSNTPERWTTRRMLMAASVAAWKGGACGIETAANANQGCVVPMSVSTSLIYVGIFAENLASSASQQLVNVDFLEELDIRWYANAGSPNNVAAVNVGSKAYFIDDQTVSKTATSNSEAGLILAYDSITNRVAVWKLRGSNVEGATGAVTINQLTVGTAYQVPRTNSDATATEWGPDPEAYAVVNATTNVTIQISQGSRRRITASGNNTNVTVSTTGARAGNVLHINRPAIGASSGCNIVNGGTGAGTLMAMTANKSAGCTLLFDGTNWGMVASYQES